MHTLTEGTDRHPCSADAIAKIGPNAVIQLVAALRASQLAGAAPAIFRDAGVGDWLAVPPAAMVDERRVARLHQCVRASLPAAQAAGVLADAGRMTADYLLANRIPRVAHATFRILPAPLSASLLVAAVRRNAWTFAGSGQLYARAGAPTVFELAGNPLCAGETAPAPVCVWHAAVFQRLFEVLVDSSSQVIETHCRAAGNDRCRFLVDSGPDMVRRSAAAVSAPVIPPCRD
jgi:divinyl protochlorophyllide a 8-vinyl-reductase